MDEDLSIFSPALRQEMYQRIDGIEVNISVCFDVVASVK